MSDISVGGQAVIEGVMMQSKDQRAIAVRKSDGKIVLKKNNIKSWINETKINKIPFLRGSFILLETMIEGVKSLNFSSEFFIEDGEEDAFDRFIKKIFKDKANDAIIGISLLLSILFAYIVIISQNSDIKRVFQYHGAEHKSIHCYESGLELTIENAKKFTTLHPRCGTNFLFIVMFTSIILFSFFGWPNPLVRVIMRILFIPIVAGISYEIIKFLGKYNNKFTKIVAYPGMMLQKFTTKEPDDEQLEVALTALKAVINEK